MSNQEENFALASAPHDLVEAARKHCVDTLIRQLPAFGGDIDNCIKIALKDAWDTGFFFSQAQKILGDKEGNEIDAKVYKFRARNRPTKNSS